MLPLLPQFFLFDDIIILFCIPTLLAIFLRGVVHLYVTIDFAIEGTLPSVTKTLSVKIRKFG